MSNIYFKVFNGLDARNLDPESLAWPDESVVIYAFNENNEIIGRIGALPLLHIEGVWVREDNRNSFMFQNLVNKIEDLLKEENRKVAMAFALDSKPEMKNYLERLNYSEMPFTVYCKPLS